MSYATPIDQILGGEAAAVLVNQIANALQYNDGLPADTAHRVACERVADGDPHFIVAPGQTWVALPHIAACMPATRYAVKQRLPLDTCVVVVATDGILAGVESEIELFTLATCYQLEAWLPIDPDLTAEPLA